MPRAPCRCRTAYLRRGSLTLCTRAPAFVFQILSSCGGGTDDPWAAGCTTELSLVPAERGLRTPYVPPALGPRESTALIESDRGPCRRFDLLSPAQFWHADCACRSHVEVTGHDNNYGERVLAPSDSALSPGHIAARVHTLGPATRHELGHTQLHVLPGTCA